MKNRFFKKSIVALSTSVALASMAVAADMPNYPVLDGVPADTFLFSGSLEAFPIKMYMELNETLLSMSSGQTPDFSDMTEDDKSAKKFFGYIAKDYYSNIGDTDRFLSSYGFGDETRMVVYTVNFVPVVKYEAADPTALWKLFDAAAADADVAVQELEKNGIKYKSYHPNNKKASSPDLIVAVSGNWVTITLGHPDYGNSHLEVALGITKPAKSINDTTILADIADKYGFQSSQMGFIDHRIIVDLITNTTPPEFVSKEDWADMKDIQSPACRAEFAQIAASWPRTVMGNTNITLTPTEYSADSKMIIESTNQDTNKALMGLRGFIPANVTDNTDQVYSMGLGLNVSQAAASLTQLWSGIMQANYECEVLIEMQKELTDANPAALGAITGMAQGVMGLSASVFEADIDIVNGQPSFKKLDALISLATDNPASQLATASMMLPPLRTVKLPEDGTPIVLNQVIPPVNMIGGETLAAAVGEHLNIYQGTKAAEVSASMKDVGIEPNGFFELFMDYGDTFKILAKVAELNGEPLPPEFSGLMDSNLKLNFGLDFSEHGIEFGAKVEMKK